MRRSLIEPIPWGKLREEIGRGLPETERICAALEKFENATVYRMKLPYGELLIKDGVFLWQLLSYHEELHHAYKNVPVPLGFVVSGCIELFEQAPGDHKHRTVPQYLVRKGEFFGLFETLAGTEAQSGVSGSVGGRTLLALPRFGEAARVKEFGGSFGWVCPNTLRDSIKQKAEAALDYGEFFAKALEAYNAQWRADLVIFPPEFVERIKADSIAALTLYKLALEQMSVARQRSESMATMLLERGLSMRSDLFAVRQIAHRIRPGFTPVFGTDVDEQILPAAELHNLLYRPGSGLFSSWNDAKVPAEPGAATEPTDTEEKAGFDYFPALFRPSLPDEDSYYFLKRPYGPWTDGKTISQRLANLKADLKVESAGRFRQPNTVEFVEMLRAQYEAAGKPGERSVRLGSSSFIEGGIVQIIKKKLALA